MMGDTIFKGYAVKEHGINVVLCLFHRFLTQYKGVYERDVKCQVKMSHNSGNVGQGPPSPSKDEVNTALLQVCGICNVFS